MVHILHVVVWWGGVEMERGPQMAVIINVVTWEFSDLMIYEASNLFNLLLVCVFFFLCKN